MRLGEVREVASSPIEGFARFGEPAPSPTLVADVVLDDAEDLGRREGPPVLGRATLRDRKARRIPRIGHLLAAAEQLDVAASFFFDCADEEVAGHHHARDFPSEDLAEGKVERAQANAASAPTLEHRRQRDEPEVGVLHLASEPQRSEEGLAQLRYRSVLRVPCHGAPHLVGNASQLGDAPGFIP